MNKHVYEVGELLLPQKQVLQHHTPNQSLCGNESTLAWCWSDIFKEPRITIQLPTTCKELTWRSETSAGRPPGNWTSVHWKMDPGPPRLAETSSSQPRWQPIVPESRGQWNDHPRNHQDLAPSLPVPHKCLRSWQNRVLPRQVKQGEGYVSVINQCHLQQWLWVCPHHTLPMAVMRRSFRHCH